jgi:hypothetical protein
MFIIQETSNTPKYEEGDDDIMELGEDYSDLIDIPFYFIKKVEK